MLDIDCFASGSTGNLYRVDDGRTRILIECGVGLKEIQRHLGFSLSTCAACLITHEHKDHSKAVKDILLRSVPCYMSRGTAQALQVDAVPGVQFISDKETRRVGTWNVTAFGVQHDAREPLGFLLDNGEDRVLYATDTYYLRYRFPPCTVLLVECNHSYEIVDRRVREGKINQTLARRLVKSHMSLENLIEFLQANDLTKVRQIYLLHLSDGNSDAEGFKRRVQQETGAEVYIAQGRVL